MGRTGSLAWRRARRVAIDAVLVAIVLVPFVLAPLPGIGQLLFGIGLFAMFGAKLLSKTDSTGGTIFHAATASHAVLRIDMSHVGTTR